MYVTTAAAAVAVEEALLARHYRRDPAAAELRALAAVKTVTDDAERAAQAAQAALDAAAAVARAHDRIVPPLMGFYAGATLMLALAVAPALLPHTHRSVSAAEWWADLAGMTLVLWLLIAFFGYLVVLACLSAGPGTGRHVLARLAGVGPPRVYDTPRALLAALAAGASTELVLAARPDTHLLAYLPTHLAPDVVAEARFILSDAPAALDTSAATRLLLWLALADAKVPGFYATRHEPVV